MHDWIKESLFNTRVKPVLILLVYINRLKLTKIINSNTIKLKDDLDNDISIIDMCINIIINNVLNIFVTSYTQYKDSYTDINNELNSVYTNIIDDINNNYLHTSITINTGLLFKDINNIYEFIENVLIQRSDKFNIDRISNIYDTNTEYNIKPGSYIYNVNNDILKIVSLENV